MLRRLKMTGLIFFLFLRPSLSFAVTQHAGFNFLSYADLTKKIIEIIRTAKRQILLASRSMEDQDLGLELISAQNRGLVVKLLVGVVDESTVEGKTMLMLLKSHNVFFAIDKTLRVESTTAMLIDDQLIWINKVLGDKAESSPLILQYIERLEKIDSFANYFEAHCCAGQAKKQGWNELPAVYDYRKKKEKRPEQLIKTLPKKLRWQKNISESL